MSTDSKPKTDMREIAIENADTTCEGIYQWNAVSNCRYTKWNLVPKNLYEQFCRTPNIWFLVIAILQLLPFNFGQLSSWDTIAPLCMMLIITFIKDCYNEYRRHQKDLKINNKVFKVWDGYEFTDVQSRDIQVGDIVMLENHEVVPADLLVLASRNENFYSDDSNVLGVTGLNKKKPLKEVQKKILAPSAENSMMNLFPHSYLIKVEQPTESFENLNGLIRPHGFPSNVKIGHQSWLLKESIVSGTPWIIGLVVYTGTDTKTLFSNKAPRRKFSRLEKLLNSTCLATLLIVLFLVIFSTLGNFYLSRSDYDDDSTEFEIFVIFIILYSNILPISMFATMDVIRLIQTYFIQNDLDMYDENTGRTAVVNISDINEDVGQVEYIFTEMWNLNSGTQEFKAALIGDNSYGALKRIKRSSSIVPKPKSLNVNTLFKVKPAPNGSSFEDISVTPAKVPCTSFIGDESSNLMDEPDVTPLETKHLCDSSFIQDMHSRDIISEDIYRFLEACAVCNTVRISRRKNEYFADQPQDLILVNAAADYGVRLAEKSMHRCTLEINGDDQKIRILGNRVRYGKSKVSGVMIQREDATGTLYIKGDYRSMKQKVKSDVEHNIRLWNSEYETDGYCPVIIAQKNLNKDEVLEFAKRYENAQSSMANVEIRINNAFYDYEKEMSLVGIAALKAETNKDSIDTIKIANEAGIKIWMLTGESEEMSISTAYGSQLLEKQTQIVPLRNITSNYQLIQIVKHYITQEDDWADLQMMASDSWLSKSLEPEENDDAKTNQSPDNRPTSDIMGGFISKLASIIVVPEKKKTLEARKRGVGTNDVGHQKSTNFILQGLGQAIGDINERCKFDIRDIRYDPDEIDFAISVDSKTLENVQNNDELLKPFLLIIFTAKTVIGHGLYPSQKAQLVRMVNDSFSFRPMTLAIGAHDADIPMIQEADIGVGIWGEEDSHVSCVADYSLQQFGHLKYLIFKHGRFNYFRMCKVIILFLYKNFFLISLFFIYIFLNDYSGTQLFDAGLLVFYNIPLITLPLITLGVIDQDLKTEDVVKHGQTYNQGIQNTLFGWGIVGKYYMIAFLHALLVGLLIVGSFWGSTINEDGHSEDFHSMSCILFMVLVFTVLGQTILENISYTLVFCLSIVISVLLLFIFLIVMTWAQDSPTRVYLGILDEVFSNPTGVLNMIFVPATCLLFSYLIRTLEKHYKPTVIDQVKMGVLQLNEIPSCHKQRFRQFAKSAAGILTKKIESAEHNNEESYKMNPITLKFVSPHIERSFKQESIDDHIGVLRLVIRIILLGVIVWTIVEFSTAESLDIAYVAVRVIVVVVWSAIALYVSTDHYKMNVYNMTKYGLCIIILAKFIIEITFSTEGGMSSSMIPLVTFITFNVDWIMIAWVNVFNLVLSVISLSVYASKIQDTAGEVAIVILMYIIILSAITIVAGFVGFWTRRAERKEFKLIRTIESKIEMSQNCLGCMLPDFVKERVKEGARYIAEDQGKVTIIFIDIVDFDSIFAQYKPQEFTTFLDDLFQQLDTLCDTSGVVKIETVGKTYMACAGLKDSEENLSTELQSMNHAQRAIEFGIDCIRVCRQIKLKNGDNVSIKIGINSGIVTAGVVGHHKPQFSLVGDPVNTASRMGSTLPFPDTIQISMSTYDLVNDPLPTHLKFEPHEVEAKGKGQLETYLVHERVDFTSDTGTHSANTSMDSDISISEIQENDYLRRAATHVVRRTKTGLGMTRKLAAHQTVTLKTRRSSLMDRVGANQLGAADATFRNGNAKSNIDMNRLQTMSQTLVMKETHAEKKFRITRMRTIRLILNGGLIVSCIVYACLLLITLAAVFEVESIAGIEILIGRILTFCILVLLFIIIKRIYTNRYYQALISVSYVAIAILGMFTIIYDSDVTSDINMIELFYNLLMIIHISGVFFLYAAIAICSIMVAWLSIEGVFMTEYTSFVGNVIFMMIFVLINTLSLYNREKHQRIVADLKRIAKAEIKQVDALIEQLMPKRAYENIKANKNATDKIDDVTMLYADIVGFTSWSSDKSPTQVVEMLSNLFASFDKLCELYDVYKVHTIGDCYVVMGYKGVDHEERDYASECMSMVQLAFSMISVIDSVNEEHGIDLNMRIGLHTGTVIAGITGTNIVRYDIYGPDAMFANKMESGGEAGKINVSDITKEIIEEQEPDHYVFNYNKKIEAARLNRHHESYFISDPHIETS